MKKTGVLKTIGDIRMPFNKLVVNPNDGYDLDILSKEFLVKIYAALSAESFEKGEGLIAEGHIVQENSCKLGTVEMNLKTLQRLGKPAQVTLQLEDNKLLIQVS